VNHCATLIARRISNAAGASVVVDASETKINASARMIRIACVCFSAMRPDHGMCDGTHLPHDFPIRAEFSPLHARILSLEFLKSPRAWRAAESFACFGLITDR
jgi:hypothetical protein